LLDAAGRLLLSDFGIGLLITSFATALAPDAGAEGSAVYMAPEQFVGQPQRASDQYALDAMVYEWLCGAPPFCGTYPELAVQHQRTPPRERAPEVPPVVKAVILRALAKQPAERFPSVEAFAAALKQAAARQQSLDLSQAISASDAVACRHRGALYEQQGDVKQAPADFNEALRLDSAYAVAYASRADLGVKQGGFERALAD
jgi:serine/threonine protein kinase